MKCRRKLHSRSYRVSFNFSRWVGECRVHNIVGHPESSLVPHPTSSGELLMYAPLQELPCFAKCAVHNPENPSRAHLPYSYFIAREVSARPSSVVKIE